MGSSSAFFSRLSPVCRHKPNFLVRGFLKNLESEPIGADDRAPTLCTGEQQLQAVSSPVRQCAGSSNSERPSQLDFRRCLAAFLVGVEGPARIAILYARPRQCSDF